MGLPEVIRQMRNDEIVDTEAVFAWLLLPKHRFPAWPPAAPPIRRGLFRPFFYAA
jgi:hypothetical protein